MTRWAPSPFSEGSVIGSLVALSDPGIAGLACLAPMARSLKDVLHYQLVDRIATWAFSIVDTDGDGRLAARELAAAPRYRISCAALDADSDGAIDAAELERGLEGDWARFVHSQGHASPWLAEHFATESNLARFPRLAIPIQLFHGEADVQTPIGEAHALAEALVHRRAGPATIRTFPGLGHGFSPPLAPDRPTVGPIAPAALDAIAALLAAIYLDDPLLARGR
jgi:fermentation-respiration switch protein FrsA (DUF1100 family)